MKRFHKWYMETSAEGLSHIIGQVREECFLRKDVFVFLTFEDLRDMFKLKKLDTQIIRLWWL